MRYTFFRASPTMTSSRIDNSHQESSTIFRRLYIFVMISLLCLVSANTQAEIARPGWVADKNRPFNEYTWITAHNAFNHSGWPQQQLTIRQQLDRGVRGFMMDLYWHNSEIYVCHGSCNALAGRVAPFREDMRTISDYLRANPDVVITLHLETYVNRERMQSFIDSYQQFFESSFNPDSGAWATLSNWPTLQQMIDRNQRLILLSSNSLMSGSFSAGRHYIFHDQQITVENTFSIGGTIGVHNHACTTRWEATPLATQNGLKGWKRLFVMNHFHTVGEPLHGDYDNRWDQIDSRVESRCKLAAGRYPNFIAIDYVDRGDALEYVEMRNNGGVVAHEGNSGTQNVVCGFSSAVSRNWSMQDSERLGCENDEMRSLKLRGMKAGQRITFYDSPGGSLNDDFAVLNIDRDIPWDSPVTVGSFEQRITGSHFRMAYSGGNGLDGKVSRIKVEARRSNMGDAAVVLLREFSGAGRISCGFGLTSSGFWNIKNMSGCHNDDAKSLRIVAAPAGTVITVYDSPSGSQSDDYTVITVTNNIVHPLVVANLESNASTSHVTVRHHHHNGLNGKVSSIRVSVPPVAPHPGTGPNPIDLDPNPHPIGLTPEPGPIAPNPDLDLDPDPITLDPFPVIIDP